MRIGKLFHLTPLVDDLAAAEAFFLGVFGPWCTARGYAAHWNRSAAIFVIADTVIEPFQPLPPEPGTEPSSWFRYMEKYGPRVLNMAFFVDGAAELQQRLNDAGVRTTDGRVSDVVFCYPRQTPGTLEFMETSAYDNDPRFLPGYEAIRDEFWAVRHGLGLQRLSHLTVVVQDRVAARAFYTDVLEATTLPDQASRFPDTDSYYVLVGEDTVLELAEPTSERSPLAADLALAGEHVVAAHFRVVDLERAGVHLDRAGAPVADRQEGWIDLDHHRTWGLRYRFSDQDLPGDPRLAGSR